MRGATVFLPQRLATHKFQSTRPVRGATFVFVRSHGRYSKFQSTRPVRGATVTSPDARLQRPISIHAPRAGRDRWRWRAAPARRHFNPRAPCGARPAVRFCSTTNAEFQSTRPVRGATRGGRDMEDLVKISIHAPRAGRDGRQGRRSGAGILISIHAPRAGRDSKSIQNYFTHFCDKRQFLDNFTQNAAF